MAEADALRSVFVYGSLLDEASLMASLGHRSDPPASQPFELDGWERAWNVVSARTFHREDRPAGPAVRRIVLGLRPAPSTRCQGVLLALDEADRAALAPREAAYDLLEVGGAEGRTPVWTYVPRPERVLGHVAVTEPLVVERAYLRSCRAGMARHELHEARAEVDAALGTLPVVDAAA